MLKLNRANIRKKNPRKNIRPTDSHSQEYHKNTKLAAILNMQGICRIK